MALLIIIAAIALLFIGYIFYGSWLAKQWGIDPTKKTPAQEKADGVDYVSAKPAVLMGHHFSSIAGAGPINGRCIWMGSSIFVVCNWRNLLWRTSGLWFTFCIFAK